MIKEINIKTQQRTIFSDITPHITELVKRSLVKEGVCTVFVPHTTAGITINENADPSVRHDIIQTLEEAIPEDSPHYTHAEGNSAAHIKASLIGSSVTIIIKDGSLLLGTWQGIYFCEFDGPRNRRFTVKISETK